jgi:hypothetical protein
MQDSLLTQTSEEKPERIRVIFWEYEERIRLVLSENYLRITVS